MVCGRTLTFSDPLEGGEQLVSLKKTPSRLIIFSASWIAHVWLLIFGQTLVAELGLNASSPGWS